MEDETRAPLLTDVATVRDILKCFLLRDCISCLIENVTEPCTATFVLSYLVRLVGESFPIETTKEILAPFLPRFFEATFRNIYSGVTDNSIEVSSNPTESIMAAQESNSETLDWASLSSTEQRQHIQKLSGNLSSLESTLLDLRLEDAPELLDDALWVTFEATALQALVMMSRAKAESIVIVNDTFTPTSMITAGDIKILVADRIDPLSMLLLPAVEFASQVQRIYPDDRASLIKSNTSGLDITLRDIINHLAHNNSMQDLLIVNDEDEVIGMVSPRRVLQKLYGKEEEEEEGESDDIKEKKEQEEEESDRIEEGRKEEADREEGKNREEKHQEEDQGANGDGVSARPKRLAKRKKRGADTPTKKRKTADQENKDEDELEVCKETQTSVTLELMSDEDDVPKTKKATGRKVKRRRKNT